MKVKSDADVAVIGGGSVGCAIAYNLAKSGVDVIVVEKDYLASGSTGRCLGGIRQQFSDAEDIRLARESIRIWNRLEDELEYDLEYVQNGYLFLLQKEDTVKQFRGFVQLQRGLGLDVEFLEADKIKDVVPSLNVEEVGALCATWCSTDGSANPFKVTQGYAHAAKKLGAKIYNYTQVNDIKVKDGEINSVLTSRGEVKTKTVVNAAGAYSAEVAKMAGVFLPIKPYRHEALATDPLEPLNRGSQLPVIIFFDHIPYFDLTQTKHGEVIITSNDPEEPPGFNMQPTLRHFISASMVTRYIPALRHVNVIRQWAGLIEWTADYKPMLGRADGMEGFIQANGFSGHGFMFAPIVGKLISELIVDGKPSISIDSFSLKRFQRARLFKEDLSTVRYLETSRY